MYIIILDPLKKRTSQILESYCITISVKVIMYMSLMTLHNWNGIGIYMNVSFITSRDNRIKFLKNW